MILLSLFTCVIFVLQILKVGNEHAPNTALSKNIEDKLEELTNENQQLEKDIACAYKLQKKKVWLECVKQDQHLQSLKSAYTLLCEKLNNNEQSLNSIERRIAAVGTESPFGQIW